MKANNTKIDLYTKNRNILKDVQLILSVIILTLIFPSVLFSQTDPRDGFPAPPGTNAFLFYQRNISGNNLYQNGHKASNNIDFTGEISMLRYAHFFKIGKARIVANAVQPYGTMHFKVGETNDRVSSLGDLVLNTVYYYPVINKEKNTLFLDAAFYVTIPTGKYYSEKAVNISGNCWAYRFLIAAAWKVNRTSLEVTANVDWFSDNDDYTASKLNLEKDTLYMIECHLTYDFTKSFYGGVTYRWKKGGETNVEGIGDMNNEMDTQQFSVAGSVTITPQTRLTLLYNTDFSVENGIAQNFVKLRFAYFF